MKIHAQLAEVAKLIAAEGIGKTRKNAQQGYNFRGVDEVMNAFAPVLTAHGIYIRPAFSERTMIERATKSGGALFTVTVAGRFAFTNADGESVEVGPIYGEAMDTADKATNKAMAVAFKYAMFQTFCVPLEGVTGGDADATTHEPLPQITPTAGAWEALDGDEQEFLLGIAAVATSHLELGNIKDAVKFIKEQNLDTDEKVALWTRFESKHRTAMTKAMKEPA